MRDVMTNEIKYCYEDQTVEEVTRNMGEQRMRRLPVMNRDKRLVGILSLGDLARKRIRRMKRAKRYAAFHAPAANIRSRRNGID